MNLIVDTSVWSLFLRRENRDESNLFVERLRNHINDKDNIYLIGPILQELLDGIKLQNQFTVLSSYLEPFPLVELSRNDFIQAAYLRNYCRTRGVQAGPVDFLIASVCISRKMSLLSADKDFYHIAKHCELLLLHS